MVVGDPRKQNFDMSHSGVGRLGMEYVVAATAVAPGMSVEPVRKVEWLAWDGMDLPRWCHKILR